ncbi:MAG: beta-ketoacyl-ACP synthase II [Proteobacteria bacterium]|nr:beta-ketoacyl-ACP synthase II [Pseudomonadota bacterium]
MTERRVVVTGIGMLTPIGNTVEETWQAALEGKSGAQVIDHFDTEGYSVRICAPVKNFDVTDYINHKEARRMDEFIQYGLAVGIQAIEHAGLSCGVSDPHRIGFAMGSGIGGISTIEETHSSLLNGGPRKVSPFFIPGSVINMISGNLSIKFGFSGPNIACVTACTTGTHNIGLGGRMIQYGDADVMVVGGAEYATSPITVAGFASMKALSARNDDPERASRPWDADRDGFLLGAGAGALVLEEYEHAKARGANILGELAGFGMSGDAYHITSPAEDGAGAVAAMKNAISDAGMNPEDIDYINAHGTSTPLGDVAETVAIKKVFGHDTKVMISSTKSMMGHLLGAAGAVEAIFTLLAVKRGICPPTINLDKPGEGCDLDYVPNIARQTPVRAGLSNSFGFGGTNGSVLFRSI